MVAASRVAAPKRSPRNRMIPMMPREAAGVPRAPAGYAGAAGRSSPASPEARPTGALQEHLPSLCQDDSRVLLWGAIPAPAGPERAPQAVLQGHAGARAPAKR